MELYFIFKKGDLAEQRRERGCRRQCHPNSTVSCCGITALHNHAK